MELNRTSILVVPESVGWYYELESLNSLDYYYFQIKINNFMWASITLFYLWWSRIIWNLGCVCMYSELILL